MALSVDIEKKTGDFYLKSRFEAEDETLAILGASGCGKSMTLKCIAGVETPDRGRILLDGTVLFDSEKKINLPARHRRTGYLFQDYALFPNMTVEQNIASGIRKGQNKTELVKEKISAFYLNGLEKLYPSQLSGGQQQRTALARMLASMPRLLMMDEPLSALDDFLKWQLEQEIIRLRESFQGTVLYVSHNLDEVYRLSNRIVIMEEGRTQQTFHKKELFNHPKTLSAALLSGCKNFSRASKTGNHTLFAEDWNTVLVSDEAVPDDLQYTGIRAHCLEAADSLIEANTIECDVLKVIEDMFSIIVLLHVTNCRRDNNRSYLRYELDKTKWAGLGNPDKLYIKLHGSRLLLMQNGTFQAANYV